MAQQALAEVPELAASVLRVELSASSLFLNLEQPEEPEERVVWVDQQEGREDVAQLQEELRAV
jgi:hypothetical protein